MRTLVGIFLALSLAAGLALAQAQAQAPKTVIHIVNVRWKAEATTEQIKAAIDAVHQLPSKYPGIKRVWLRPLSVQGAPIGKCDTTGVNHAIVMEFESEASLKAYADSDAQKAFYENYIPHRDQSRTHDITN